MSIFNILLRKVRTVQLLLGRRHIGFLNHYSNWIDALHNDNNVFVPYTKNPYKRESKDAKIFAFYLTQYHAIPENDIAYGKGFTEWTNVASCTPQFVGHEQPKIPYDLGFYNLLMPGVMERQAKLANDYGVYGWCFYYYWFSGKKVLEKPLEYFLQSDIPIAFHLCWANESWSKLWDGGNKEIIFEQRYQLNDADLFYHDIEPYLRDSRYERIDNKPILMIYRPRIMEYDYCVSFINRLQELSKQNGFEGLYIVETQNGEGSPSLLGINAKIEFRPHGMWMAGKKVIAKGLSHNVTTNVRDISDFIHNKEYIEDLDYPIYRGCFPSWDNSPRKAYSGGYCFPLSTSLFKEWLKGCLEWTRNHHPSDKQYVYINAWNEWAEGAILEPTTRHGYANLQVIKECLEESRK